MGRIVETSLPRTTAEAAGVDEQAIQAWLAALGELNEIHSAMLLRHGQVVAEHYWPPHTADEFSNRFSLSKTVTALAVGIAINEGLFKLDDRVIDLLGFDSKDAPENRNLKDLTVRHLLTMSAGNQDFEYFLEQFKTKKAIAQEDWVAGLLKTPFAYEPGARFSYNTATTFLLSAIIHKLTGERLLNYVKAKLFQPLGIKGVKWERNPAGIDMGGTGIQLKTEDIAKLGQLILNKGEWQGTQIVPAKWIEAMTTKQIDNSGHVRWVEDETHDNDWEQGYGYQMWICRNDAVRGDGMYGQFMIIWPKYDAVIAMTANTDDMPAQLNTLWTHLEKAFALE